MEHISKASLFRYSIHRYRANFKTVLVVCLNIGPRVSNPTHGLQPLKSRVLMFEFQIALALELWPLASATCNAFATGLSTKSKRILAQVQRRAYTHYMYPKVAAKCICFRPSVPVARLTLFLMAISCLRYPTV